MKTKNTQCWIHSEQDGVIITIYASNFSCENVRQCSSARPDTFMQAESLPKLLNEAIVCRGRKQGTAGAISSVH